MPLTSNNVSSKANRICLFFEQDFLLPDAAPLALKPNCQKPLCRLM
jgi:hypothetical protein